MTESSPNAVLAPGGKVEANLEIKTLDPSRKMTLRIEAETTEGKTDVSGRFEVDPLL